MRLWLGTAASALTVTAVMLSGCGTEVGAQPPVGQPRTAAARPAGQDPAAPASPLTAAPPAAGTRPAPTHQQIITVIAPAYGATSATLTARAFRHGRWHRVLGPWPAFIGRNGFAPPGAKREGDGRTPSGTFGFPFLFGVLPNPGVTYRYRRVHPYDVWDDDPASPRYNEWVDGRHASAGASPEPMDVSAYDYGAVIGYNTSRVPGLGSAIFLHVNIGIPTAGCVTLPRRRLLAVLRWLAPADSPLIRMGVR